MRLTKHGTQSGFVNRMHRDKGPGDRISVSSSEHRDPTRGLLISHARVPLLSTSNQGTHKRDSTPTRRMAATPTQQQPQQHNHNNNNTSSNNNMHSTNNMHSNNTNNNNNHNNTQQQQQHRRGRAG